MSGRADITGAIAEIFERRGGEEYLGEPVTMAEHMLQAAALAERAGMDEEIVVAALLHDIGHFTSDLGMFTMQDEEDRLHEEAGAELLGGHFPSVVTDCVRHHVDAKRYLCAARPDYLAKLSEASLHSLALQGGPMDDDERRAFERNPNLPAILAVRELDEAAKIAGMETPTFSHFAPMVRRVAERHATAGVS